MSRATEPQGLKAELQAAVDGIKTEAGQRAAAIRLLATHGHHAPPKVTAGRMDGNTLRLYAWTVDGGIILATGPNFTPKVFSPGDVQTPQPGIYILAGADKTKAQATAERMAARAAARVVASKETRETVKRALPRERRAAAKAVRTVRATARSTVSSIPSPASIEAAERQELAEALRAILGES